MGLMLLVFGLAAMLGVWMVDSAAHRVNWSLPGVWLWFGGLGVISATGLALLWRGRSGR